MPEVLFFLLCFLVLCFLILYPLILHPLISHPFLSFLDREEEISYLGGAPGGNPVIFIPFADFQPEQKRNEQLAHFIEKVGKEKIDIVVCEQIEPVKYFNRGQVLNAGIWWYSKHIREPDLIIFHDVDMIPDKKLLREYKNPRNYPMSFVPVDKDFMEKYGFALGPGGGIYGIQMSNFRKCNGYPNDYWGWGGEDNAFEKRTKKNNIGFSRVKRGKLEHIDEQRQNNQTKMEYLRKNEIRSMITREQLAADDKTWQTNGFAQIPELDLEICDSREKNIFRLRIKLSPLNLEKVIDHNKKIYEQIKTENI